MNDQGKIAHQNIFLSFLTCTDAVVIGAIVPLVTDMGTDLSKLGGTTGP